MSNENVIGIEEAKYKELREGGMPALDALEEAKAFKDSFMNWLNNDQ